jgi:hypothetical protein
MILEKQTEALVHQEGETQESISMSLDLDSAQILMQMLSKNLYSDSIGSTIRECASNALDSHRRAGVDEPIIVSLQKNQEDNFEFSVEDFGTGLDAEDVKNIISKYGKSTKRNSANELGMMGLGFKAPLAYSSSFYFVCRKDGMERKYMMYEGEDVNTIDLLYETPTTERNGVKVIVPIDYSDRYIFRNKIREQLAYFENVYFNAEAIDNDFSIIRSEHFQFSELASDSSLHICLDNVYYPLDFNKLEISRIYIPVALRFSLTDGIYPTPNRESIRYTQEAKDIILNKLSLMANYFVEKYNASVENCKDVPTIVDYLTSSYRYVNLSESRRYDISNIMQYASVKMIVPKLDGIELFDIERLGKIQEYVLDEYAPKFFVDGKRIRQAKHYYRPTAIKSLPERVYIYSGDKLPGIMKDYIKHLQRSYTNEAMIVKKTKEFKLYGKKFTSGEYDNYHRIIGLGAYPKHQWRQVIKEFQHIVKLLSDNFIDIDKLEIPQEFIDMRKAMRAPSVSRVKVTSSGQTVRRTKLKGEMICKVAEDLERWVDGKNCKWVSKTFQMENFHKNNFILVYGSQEEVEKMDKWYKATKGTRVRFAVLSDREMKVAKGINLHNLMSFSKFMEGKNKPFQRIATACLIDKLMYEHRHLFSEKNELCSISKSLHEMINGMESYRDKHFKNVNDDVRNIIIDYAKEVNAFDPSIYDDCKKVEEISKKFPFINVILGELPHYNSERKNVLLAALVDLLKYHKHRINWENYKIVLNEDAPLQETLTEDTIEVLENQD